MTRGIRDMRSVSMFHSQNAPLGIWRGLGVLFLLDAFPFISYPGNCFKKTCHPGPPSPPVLRGGDCPCGGDASACHGSTMVIGFVPKTWFFFWTPSKWPINGGLLTSYWDDPSNPNNGLSPGKWCPILMVFLCILRFGSFITHGEDWKLGVESWEESWRLTG